MYRFGIPRFHAKVHRCKICSSRFRIKSVRATKAQSATELAINRIGSLGFATFSLGPSGSERLRAKNAPSNIRKCPRLDVDCSFQEWLLCFSMLSERGLSYVFSLYVHPEAYKF